MLFQPHYMRERYYHLISLSGLSEHRIYQVTALRRKLVKSVRYWQLLNELNSQNVNIKYMFFDSVLYF